MIHRNALIGYWGVNANHDNTAIVVLAGSGGDQARAVLTPEQAQKMIEQLYQQINKIKGKS